jgi:transposase-like protein
MERKCPNCKSFNVRRSSAREFGLNRDPLIRSPYRCRACGEMFMVIGRRTYRHLGIALGINLAFFVLIYWIVMMANSVGSAASP